ncbi:MAG: ubiquitin-like protein Pup [Propionibacteriaceae bacterium]
MAWRKQIDKQTHTQQTEQAQTWQTQQTTDLDDILDEINAVLEVNAEEFVKGFVQKGGQ